MEHYDPDTAPDPRLWLELDEGERMLLVSSYHLEPGEGPDDDPSHAEMHVRIHVMVENQLAEGYAPAVAAMSRLCREGLDRHDAVHAIGSVLAEHIWSRLQGKAGEGNDAYEDGLRTLTRASWYGRYGDSR